MTKRLGPHALAREIRQTRTIFKYAYESGMLEIPVKFGMSFKPPSKRIFRATRHAKGPKMFEAREVRRLLKNCSLQLKAMILLGVNCGFGNSDCGRLPLSAVDLQSGWIDFPRPKTAIERCCPLWPETIEALNAAMANRSEPISRAGKNLLFLTFRGRPWFNDTSYSPISQEFAKLVDLVNLKKPGRGFYTMRHVFETIGGESRDQVAVNAIMGHVDSSMAANYRERISDQRLRDVVNFVRAWLFRRNGGEQWRSRRIHD